MPKPKMTEIVTAGDFDSFAEKIEVAIIALDKMNTPEELTQADKQIRLLREWAKMNGRIDELREKILWLELKALKRIGELADGSIETAKTMLSGPKLKASMFFATLTDDELEKLRDKFPSAITAGQIITAWKKEQDREKQQQIGREFAAGKKELLSSGQAYVLTTDDEHRCWHTKTIKNAIEQLLENYAIDGVTFTIQNLADNILLNYPELNRVDSAFREGIKEVCRAAVRDEKIDLFEQAGLPAFVTVISKEGYVRIPIGSANKIQLQELLKLRQGQAAALNTVVKKLEKLIADLDGVGAADDVPIKTFLSPAIYGVERHVKKYVIR